MLPYLDDFLVVGGSQQHAAALAAWLRDRLMPALGITPHPTKCTWVPTQRLQHLGMTIDTIQGVFELTPARTRKIKHAAKDLICQALGQRRLVLKRTAAQVAGLAQACRLACPPAQFFLRALYNDIGARPDGWSSCVRLSRQSLRDLQWWADLPPKFTRAPMAAQPASYTLFADASLTGWGATLNRAVACGLWRPHQRGLHITELEALAVRLALESFSATLRGATVRVMEDNTAAEALLRTHASRSPAMMRQYRRIWAVLQQHSITVQVQRVASADNKADAPSRRQHTADFQLHPAAFQLIQRLYGPHTVDRFASASSTQLPVFNSQWHCPGTNGVDALAQDDWGDHNSFCHPPYAPALLLRLAQHLRLAPCSCTVVVPNWPGQPWLYELLDTCKEVLHLPRAHSLFSPCLRASTALHPPLWDLLVLRFTAGPPATA